MSKLTALWAYQEAELRKAQVENTIRSTPSRIQFNKLHKLLKAQQATITKMTEEVDARIAQCERLADSIQKLEERMDMEQSELATMQQDEESTAEEMAELRGDIEKLNREMNAAAREAKGLLTELERTTEEYQRVRQVAGKAKKEYDALRVVCEKERDDSQGVLNKCDEELARIRQNIDPALMARYEQVKLHHPTPIAKVVNNKCGGCNMSLPMVMLKRLANPDAVVECENCGRILFNE